MYKLMKVFSGILVASLFLFYGLQLYDVEIVISLLNIRAASFFKQLFDIAKKEHFLIYSSIYYNVSKLYSPNSMIMVLNTHKLIETQSLTLQCYSKNETSISFSKLQIRLGHKSPGANCQWETFIANCSTVLNPIFFGITSHEFERNAVILKYDVPVSEKYPAIMCYTPLVYESRWQQIIFATEIYHYFGIDMQIQYVNSAMKPIMDILKIYEKNNWVKIKEFVYHDYDNEVVKEIGYHPSKESISRNQLTAQADCVMRYREASEFIISADIDDVLFPKEKNYYTEFLKWAKIHPNAAGFIYPRTYLKIDTSNDFQSFSLSAAIESIKISNSSFIGKPILRTDRVETPWIHWFGLSNGDAVTLDPKDVFMAHVQISAEKIRTVTSSGSILNEYADLNTLNSFNPLSNNDIQAINTNFVSSFKNITNFVSNFIYADIIFKCFKESENWNQDYCYTQFRCGIPNNITNFECETVQRDVSTKKLNENLIFYIPESKYFWINSKDNCKIFK